MKDTLPHKPSKSQLKLWGNLDTAEARSREGILLAEGFKVVGELLKSAWEVRALLVMDEKRDRWGAFLSGLPERREVYNLTAAQWRKLSQDKNPEGIMAVVALSRPAPISDLPASGHALFAYRINNPNNLGALLRSAHWFGFGAVVISAGSVDFTNPKVVRSSMGSIFHLTVIPDVDFAGVLPEIRKRYFLIASQADEGIMPHPCTSDTALLLGSESHGLPDSLLGLAGEKWRIPGTGDAESLSLPQAAAIMMYECAKGRIGNSVP
ncbi:MAG: RNA methyltransferase [Deltaproteobacteria bacterium]|nr:RNA methyltransferase [Deltaproteobacteria bacterium]